MIRIVVAEDKHPILRNIVKKIEAYGSQLTVVEEASDGLAALEACVRHNPHVVFTDIRMPGIDGLQLIAEAKSRCPETIFVIISGYNDFEYAREAMRLGVTEFLLKPVTQEAIGAILDITVKQARANEYDRQHKMLAESLRGRGATAEECRELRGEASFFVVLLCAGPMSRFLLDLSDPFRAEWLQGDLPDFLNRTFEGMDTKFWLFDGDAANETVVVLETERDGSVDFESLYEAFLSRFGSFAPCFSFAVSPRVKHPNELKLEYRFTRLAMEKRAVFGRSNLIFAKDSPLDGDAEAIFDKPKLVSLIKTGKKEAFFSELETLLGQWGTAGTTQRALEAGLLRLLRDIAEHASGVAARSKGDFRLELDEVVSMSADYPSLLRNLRYVFDRFFPAEHSEAAPGSTGKLMEVVEAHLRDKLSENISMTDVAEMVHLNVSFLSREFKKRYGFAPVEYLTRLRIDKAKRLLREETDYKFKEIADIVGFGNPYYFSKVFKLATGITPTEYKSSVAN